MRKLITFLILIFIICSALLLSAFAEDIDVGSDNTQEESFPAEEGWLPISKASDWATIKAGGKYYLTNDIAFDPGKKYIPSADESVDLIIDGNNCTITLTQAQRALFSRTTRLTLRNVSIEGDLIYSDGAGMNSPIVQWDNLESTNLTNVVSRVNYIYTNYSSTYTSISGVIVNAPAGSVFKNVQYSGNITVDIGARLLGVAGIVNTAKDAELIDCVNDGNIRIKGSVYIGASDRVYFPVGGICARCSDYTQFEGCINNGTIISYANVNRFDKKGSGEVMIGGIIGYSFSDSFVDCENRGTISQKLVGDTSPRGYVGGIVGFSEKITNLDRCKNSGEISCEEDKFAVGGIIGISTGTKMTDSSNTGDICLSNNNCFVGGIQGYVKNGSFDITNSSNEGNISLTEGASTVSAGGFLGSAEKTEKLFKSVWIENCSNSGDIIASENETDLYIGGIIGKISGMSALYCQHAVNLGDITNGINRTSSATGGIIGLITSVSAQESNVVYEIDSCINSGVLYGNDRVGGIVGGIGKFMNNEADIYISHCSNRGKLIAVTNAGGILGYFNESNYDSTQKTYSSVGFKIEFCENSGTVLSTSSAGGIVGALSDNNTEPQIEIISCVNIGSVGEDNSGVVTSASGGIIGKAAVPVVISDSLSVGNVFGKEFHALGNGTISGENNFYLCTERTPEIENAEPLEAARIAEKRAEMDVLVYDRGVLQDLLDFGNELKSSDYEIGSWMFYCDARDEAEELLKKGDTELTQAEVFEQAKLLSEMIHALELKQTEEEKPTATTVATEGSSSVGTEENTTATDAEQTAQTFETTEQTEKTTQTTRTDEITETTQTELTEESTQTDSTAESTKPEQITQTTENEQTSDTQTTELTQTSKTEETTEGDEQTQTLESGSDSKQSETDSSSSSGCSSSAGILAIALTLAVGAVSFKKKKE